MQPGGPKNDKDFTSRERKEDRKREKGERWARGKGAEQKLRCIVAVGFLLYPRLRTADAYGENFIFVHFSSSNQFQKLDYFSPSQSFAARGRSRGLLHSRVYTCMYTPIYRPLLSRSKINVILRQGEPQVSQQGV